jgi:beta-lactamase regulating signal transducer with metallopeptidase domain
MMSTLLSASIDGAVLVAIVWAVTHVVRLSPAIRTVLWWCVAAKFVLALAWPTPITIPILPAAVPAPAIERQVSVADDVMSKVGARVGTRVGARVSSRLASRLAPDSDIALLSAIGQPLHALREWGSWALIAWVSGLILMAYVASRRWRETRAMVRAAVPAARELQEQAAALGQRLGLRRVPDVRVSGEIATPLVTGFVRPVVILPADRVSLLTTREVELTLCHELLHVKRADLWFGFVPALAERLFFFHPLVQFASREYSLAREAACDAAVVETLDAAPREYGHLLLALGVSRPQTATAAGAAQSFQHFKRRIAMLQDVPSRSDRSRVIAATVVALALVAIVPLRLGARPSPAPQLTSERGTSVPRSAQSSGDVSQPVVLEVEQPRPLHVAQEPRGSSDSDVRFVLLREDKQAAMSGSRDDERRARSYQRNGEPLLWFYRDGHEYVVRDRDVVRQVEDAWNRVMDSGLDRDVSVMAQHVADSVLASNIGDIGAIVGEQAGSIGAVVGEHVGEIAANAAMIAAPAAELGAQMAGVGIEAAADVLRALGPALSQLGDLDDIHIHIDTDQLKRQQRSITDAQREFSRDMKDLQDRIQRDVERSLKNDFHLQQQQMQDLQKSIRDLQRSLGDIQVPLNDLKQPMKDFSRQMESLGRTIGEHAREAADETRAIINRAMSSGLAERVK